MALASEPVTFDDDVRKPGLRALAELCGKQPKVKRRGGRPFQRLQDVTDERDIPPEKFPNYWVRCLDDLMEKYDQICAYSCFRIHPVTGARSADHFAAKSRSWQHVYEWSNYRHRAIWHQSQDPRYLVGPSLESPGRTSRARREHTRPGISWGGKRLARIDTVEHDVM